MRLNKALSLFVLIASSLAHSIHDQVHYQSSPRGPTWVEKYGPQIDQPFSGPLSFSHLPYVRCLQEESTDFDIAVLGLPFDTAVSYRPGYLIKTNSIVTYFLLSSIPSLARDLDPMQFVPEVADRVTRQDIVSTGETIPTRSVKRSLIAET